MSALWRDLFRVCHSSHLQLYVPSLSTQVIFNMPIHFLFTGSSVDKLQQHYSAAAEAGADKKSKGVEEKDRENSDHRRTTRHDTQVQLQISSSAHVFWPIGTRVVTVYGTGSVVGIDKVTGIHEVSSPSVLYSSLSIQ